MYNREDYREALEEREKCDLYSDEWRFARQSSEHCNSYGSCRK